MNTISIVEFEDIYADDFKKLNIEWLDKYHLTESHDLEVLNDPLGTIIKGGGFIYLALHHGKVIGSAALIKLNEGEFELAKMSVSSSFQGRGIAKMLIEKCLAKAKQVGTKKILLYSNSQLQKAIRLYTNYGFRNVPVTDSPFLTADVKMELEF